MADNIVDITFDNDQLTDANGVTLSLNGTIEVDYTTGTYKGNYSFTRADGSTAISGTDNVQIPNSLGPNTASNIYTINDGYLSVTYDGQQPTQTAPNAGFYSLSEKIYPDGTNPNAPGAKPTDTYNGLTQQPLTATPVCFATGTLIRTAHGDVAVEALAVGDTVVTASGATRPIVWIGHRTMDCRRQPGRHEVMPIRISAHAFGSNAPSRDLTVSPGHSICVNVGGEVLIPAGALVNGRTIVRQSVDTVTYWHVELDSHDIVLANGLPAESYLDMGNRGFFAETAVVGLAMRPDVAVLTHDDFCRPYVGSGTIVDAVRARLEARAEALGSDRRRNAA